MDRSVKVSYLSFHIIVGVPRNQMWIHFEDLGTTKTLAFRHEGVMAFGGNSSKYGSFDWLSLQMSEITALLIGPETWRGDF